MAASPGACTTRYRPWLRAARRAVGGGARLRLPGQSASQSAPGVSAGQLAQEPELSQRPGKTVTAPPTAHPYRRPTGCLGGCAAGCAHMVRMLAFEATVPNSVEISVLGWHVMSRQPVRIIPIFEDLLRQPGKSGTAPPGETSTSLAPGVRQGSSPGGVFAVVPRHFAPLVPLLRIGGGLPGSKGPASFPAVVLVALVAHPEVRHAAESATGRCRDSYGKRARCRTRGGGHASRCDRIGPPLDPMRPVAASASPVRLGA